MMFCLNWQRDCAARRPSSCAPTGAGKTTRVPPAIARAGLGDDKRILVLQPRRVAARATAARMAAENGWTLGDEVGYQVRFEERLSRQTRIAVVTEGVVLRQLYDDPFLQEVGVVIFDEFHERNLNSDLALGMVRQIQQSVRPELRIVVMSATLATEPITEYLDKCPAIECLGRTFPVEISYLSPAKRQPSAEAVAVGVKQLLGRTDGDVLVFLPGLREIRQAKHLLAATADASGCELLELYGDLPLEQQHAVLEPGPHRKIVLATNVAETSLTIPGVTAVVDSGWAQDVALRSPRGLGSAGIGADLASGGGSAGGASRPHPARDLPPLVGRAQPTGEAALRGAGSPPRGFGQCRAATGLLDRTGRGCFSVVRAASAGSHRAAQRLLKQLGTADEHGVTKLGRRIARLPVHPRLGRLLTEADRRGCVDRAALAAALLSERSPFGRIEQGGTRRRHPDYHSSSDLLDQVAALEEYEATGRCESVWGPMVRPAARSLFQVRDQLARRLGGRKRRRHPAAMPTRRCCDRSWPPFRIDWPNAVSRDRAAA